MPMKVGSKRLNKILNARDDALPLIEALGEESPTGRQLKLGDLSLSYYRGFSLPHALNIWTPSNKVLNIEWNDDGDILVIGYKSGGWHETLSAFLAHLRRQALQAAPSPSSRAH
jgi:hypothetical protein